MIKAGPPPSKKKRKAVAKPVEATVTEAVTLPSRRVYASDAERQRAYRQRKGSAPPARTQPKGDFL